GSEALGCNCIERNVELINCAFVELGIQFVGSCHEPGSVDGTNRQFGVEVVKTESTEPGSRSPVQIWNIFFLECGKQLINFLSLQRLCRGSRVLEVQTAEQQVPRAKVQRLGTIPGGVLFKVIRAGQELCRCPHEGIGAHCSQAAGCKN